MISKTRNSRTWALLAVSTLLAAAPGASLLANTYERPPSFPVAKIATGKSSGVNYKIKDPVQSDGLFRLYVLTTPYGEFNVQGDQMLHMRLKELAALDALERHSQSDHFTKAVFNAGLSPVKYTGKLLTDPVKTVSGTFAGIGALFGSVQSGINNMGKTQDDTLASLLGVNKERRALATKLGVDPYTDFPPLDAKLKQLSEAAATGGLAVTGAMMLIPGGAGIAVSNLSTVSKLEDTPIEDIAQSYTIPQLADLNRKRLTAMGIDKALIDVLFANRNFTPIDVTVMVASLDSLHSTRDRKVFLQRAATASTRAIAYVMRRHAEMLVVQYGKSGTLARFVFLGGFPFNVTRDGGVAGVMPIDTLSWTETTARIFTASSADMKRLAPKAGAELRITGQATALAKERLKALGWRVVENARI